MAHGRFGGRTLARSQALQLLFQSEASGRDIESILEDDYLVTDGPLEDYARELAMGAGGMVERIDKVMESISDNWSVSRMNDVDRALMRVAVYEILVVDEVDPAVTISESVELAKAYGTDESSRFVNGILGRVAERKAAGEDLLAASDDGDGADDTRSDDVG